MQKASSPIEDLLQEHLAAILHHLGVTFRKFKVDQQETVVDEKTFPLYRIDIDTDEAGLLIGYYGETIYALQQILKTIMWKLTGENVLVVVDVDSYRLRQEESVKKLAERKVDQVRKSGLEQALPPMSSYFRRIVHLYLRESQFNDITTESSGEGEHRQVVIRMKTA